MSNIGRGQAGALAPEVLEVVRQVVRELEGFSRATGQATAAAETGARQQRDTFRVASAGFYRNAAFSAADHLTRDFAAHALGSAVRGSFNAADAAFRALGNVPIVGDLFSQATQSADNAKGRALGITSQIARAGGTVTDEMRESLLTMFRDQEASASAEERAVERKAAEIGLTESSLQGTRLLELFNGFVDNLEKASRALEKFFGAGPAHR